MDLKGIVGNRKEKYQVMDIKNFKLMRNTLQLHNKHKEELEKLR